MRVIVNTSPEPRLLNSAVEEPRATKSPAEQVDLSSSPKGGNGRAVVDRIALGAFALLVLALAYSRHQATKSSAVAAPGFITVATTGEAVGPITAAMIHVTAISLGHPRLALINGQQVTEGDHVTLHLSKPVAVVKLHVLKIADGQVDFGDETQVISARVEVPGVKNPSRP
jgi:hypothetical protein